mmetsp:Transcript_31805/g.53149  ORF Transcript_31805/g.53149 Transcript_31805/m.53149 type:complete len:295 (+) Transcript_31805:341-1225(+)|eukprot:CAMPEP_0178741454 /NCGR_PEP_ID=MMETSP0744-20121128/5147_1 /TAXON_ID=913974 /ORGANISM="Nitzschia punctata, Strain CCMP561" /LENGTH=294 /DNA_ID=CAMNT_0020394325 /DNA_START=151 /DNA_END=1035 /DNA_ORIENTATION=+
MKLQKILKGRSPETTPIPSCLSSPKNSQELQTVKKTDDSSQRFEITNNDVLFGRGKPYQGHAGNIRLHQIVNLYRPRYSGARRHEKTEMAEEIVQIIKTGGGSHLPGRFLKKLDGDEHDAWVEVSDIVAREKVSHALRGNQTRTTATQGVLRSTVTSPTSVNNTSNVVENRNHLVNHKDKDELAAHATAEKKRMAIEVTVDLMRETKKRRIEEILELDTLLRQCRNEYLLKNSRLATLTGAVMPPELTLSARASRSPHQSVCTDLRARQLLSILTAREHTPSSDMTPLMHAYRR